MALLLPLAADNGSSSHRQSNAQTRKHKNYHVSSSQTHKLQHLSTHVAPRLWQHQHISAKLLQSGNTHQGLLSARCCRCCSLQQLQPAPLTPQQQLLL